MDLGGNYNRTDMPEDEFALIPAGDYTAIISETNEHPYKDGSGNMLKVVYDIIDGPAKGRKVFDYMNLFHPTSEKTKTIAWSDMGKILDALNLNTVGNSNELVGKPMLVTIDIDGDFNRVKKWSKAGGATTTAPTASSSTASDTPAATKAPWTQW